MSDKIKQILLIEDDLQDVRLFKEMFKESDKFSFKLFIADKLSVGIKLINEKCIDITLLDLTLPDSHGFETFIKLKDLVKNIPIIVLTGLIDESMALKTVKSGAQDYLIKNQITGEILIRSIRYSIERNNLVTQLQKSLLKIKKLTGLLPICASCKKIRDDQGYWIQLEEYIQDNSNAEFTHGICPGCKMDLLSEVEKSTSKEQQISFWEKINSIMSFRRSGNNNILNF